MTRPLNSDDAIDETLAAAGLDPLADTRATAPQRRRSTHADRSGGRRPHAQSSPYPRPVIPGDAAGQPPGGST